ncbi:CRISPR-associated protein Cse2 [Actinomyces sp. oral taxon 414]|uniref:type I-E CRISPR-associated protein Cse2/CasB n=1 Tax=Actinomyces sp. oral taxon 414 TaxID=712122 RepID=UPI0006B0333D|nr:type I-E CRISPR-associated protein Cse2/CasB [Actinomyces sp. oral taxon 414]ALC98671.1 CRISPR-associated protein Cse2 [Actinomyces sp. oral taxon 414]
MTTSDISTSAQAGGAPPDGARRSRPLGEAGRLVDWRIGGPRGLQGRYCSKNRKEALARAQVAALRKGASRSPGELPEIWELTRVEVPDGAGDAPTWEEIAVHTAMTLYAVHQQSRTEPMFRPSVGLGSAAHDLVGRDEENPSARARFNALVTSTTVAELRHHLRGFVSLLRARGIALDHAMLADDIVGFQRPGGAKKVRLNWARQYYSLPAESQPATAPASDADSTTAPTQEN